MIHTERAYAKINLSLDVMGKFDNGYHDLKTVMQMVDVYDDVVVKTRDDQRITLNISGANLEASKDNIAYRAASAMIQTFDISHGYDITIHKRIPIAAGLAGGSADGSAVIRAIVKLERLNPNLDTLIALAANIGADLPFCLVGGTALCEGIGDRLTPITSRVSYTVVAVNNGTHLSTPDVFRALDFKTRMAPPRAPEVKLALETGDYQALLGAMSNDLTAPATALEPSIQQVFKDIKRTAPDIVQLSGSGPTVFALFKDRERACKAHEALKATYHTTFLLNPKEEAYYEL